MTGHAARVVLVACLLLAGVSGALAADDGRNTELGAETFAQSPVDADSVVLDILLHENGTATWRVAYRVELTSGNETAAFESLQSDIRENTTSYTSAFGDRMARTARSAENATDRSMSIRDVRVSTSTEQVQGFGTVEYYFQWTNFSTVDSETITAGDALAGFFLEEDARLLISWPDGYRATDFAVEPDEQRDRTAAWEGPVEFGSAGPQVTAQPESGPPLLVFLGATLVGITLALGAWYLMNQDELPDDEPAEPQQPEQEEQPAEELLSNEERVLRLLDERGGRVKQQEVATQFDWTDAKTSQVVKTLREDDEVDVFRLGRENVLVLPDESDL